MYLSQKMRLSLNYKEDKRGDSAYSPYKKHPSFF